MSSCIFCKIVAGEIPCFQIYEDELVKAFLDMSPAAEGHTLVIPKEHYENVFEAPDEVMAALNLAAKKLAVLSKERLGATGVNILNASGKTAQQSVFHLHYHVVPRCQDDGLDLGFHGKTSVIEDLRATHKKFLS